MAVQLPWFFKSTGALVLALALSACGGGGSSGAGSGGGSTTSTGVFLDSAVGGMDYYIDGVKAGTTGSDGSFTYQPGKAVTFQIGAVKVGTTGTGDLSKVTPSDLTTNATALSNILVLLQSMDSDKNPNNGITIAASDAAKLVTSTDLSSNTSSLTSVKADIPSLTLVTSTAAFLHLTGSSSVSTVAGGVIDSVVGYWFIPCTSDGPGSSQENLAEIAKVASNKIWFKQNSYRDYATTNCTGPFTVISNPSTGTEITDFSFITGAVANSDGTISTTFIDYEVLASGATQAYTTKFVLSASKTQFTGVRSDGVPFSGTKISSFAFPN